MAEGARRCDHPDGLEAPMVRHRMHNVERSNDDATVHSPRVHVAPLSRRVGGMFVVVVCSVVVAAVLRCDVRCDDDAMRRRVTWTSRRSTSVETKTEPNRTGRFVSPGLTASTDAPRFTQARR
jgi:hypothetical protein